MHIFFFQVHAKDSLPRNVCKNCERQLRHFYEFREVCYNSYYSLSHHPTLYNAKENFTTDKGCYKKNASCHGSNEDVDDDGKNYCTALKSHVVQETDVCSEQDTSFLRKLHAISSDECTESEAEFDKEEAPAQNLQANRVSAERMSSHIVDEERLDSADGTENEQIETKFCNEERTIEEIDFSEAASSTVRYKCIACTRVFTDFKSAFIHCEGCSGKEQTESFEYLDESYNERTERIQVIEDRSLRNGEKIDEPSDIQNQSIYQSKPSDMHSVESSRSLRDKLSMTDRMTKTHKCSKSHSCSNCERVFSSAGLLRRHKTVHTGERPYECTICKKHFSQIGQLNFHKKFHENPRYRCDVCKKPFLRPSDIEKHMRTHTGEKPYGCKVCSKAFAQLVALQQHERIHTGDKPYNCEICGKRFSQKANKTKHVKIHKEGAKPHTCEICGRSFSDVEEMSLHRAGHGGGKPRKCNYCEERFRKISELAQHVRRYHTFERPHECAFCQKAFYSLYNLKQHIMVHTGQKPYACTRCDLKFTQKGNLTKHFERKHTNKYNNAVENEGLFYACSQCDVKFTEKDYLIVHFQQKHSDSMSNEIKYFEITKENCSDGKTEGILMLMDNRSDNINDSLAIEREETVEIVTGKEGAEDNLQIYDIA